MAARSNPTVKRRRLAAELRRHREESGLTIEDVAAELEWSSAKISRIENARVSVLPRDVKFLMTIYGVTSSDPAWDVMLGLARESRQKGWWQQYGEAVPNWFESYVGLEADAASIWGYDAEFVPGVLQTEDYALAVHRAQLITATDEEIHRLVRVRMERQEQLHADDGPQLWLILNEAVIRRVVGSRGIMRAQLERLIEVSNQPSVTLQVVPFTAGAHPAMDGSFNLLSFPEPTDPQVVYIEYHTGASYLEKQADTDRYRAMFDHLRAAAAGIDASRDLMVQAVRQLE